MYIYVYAHVYIYVEGILVKPLEVGKFPYLYLFDKLCVLDVHNDDYVCMCICRFYVYINISCLYVYIYL
jgi:hypothetical protein